MTIITPFQVACLLVFSLAGYIVVVDPLAAYIVANFHIIVDKVIFSRWYLICTHPIILTFHVVMMPETSVRFYRDLSTTLFKKFPELIEFTED